MNGFCRTLTRPRPSPIISVTSVFSGVGGCRLPCKGGLGSKQCIKFRGLFRRALFSWWVRVAQEVLSKYLGWQRSCTVGSAGYSCDSRHHFIRGGDYLRIGFLEASVFFWQCWIQLTMTVRARGQSLVPRRWGRHLPLYRPMYDIVSNVSAREDVLWLLLRRALVPARPLGGALDGKC